MTSAATYLSWLVEAALPLWAEHGLDRERGGFHEKLDRDLVPTGDARRARVLGRQIHVYARAPALGWKGPAREIVNHGLAALPAFLRADGLVHFRLDTEGRPLDARPDLYDQAFILFGLAHALPLADDPLAVRTTAQRMRQALVALRAHPMGGFEEDDPPSVPLKANPHMHLFEAALAWAAADGSDAAEHSQWLAMSDALAGLALRHFLDPETGAVREYYDHDWSALPAEGRVQIEPGHQFEWGWLLTRWGRMRDHAGAMEAGRRLVDLAERYGVDAARGVVFGGLAPELTPIDHIARLWPQTERIKAWVQRRDLARDADEHRIAQQRIEAAVNGLMPYLQLKPEGLFHDRMRADGGFIAEASPASSLYHLMTAAEELAGVRPPDRG